MKPPIVHSVSMQTVEWLGWRLVVPADWEIVRHSVHLEQGQLVFVDRRRQRLEFSWVSVLRPPALEQLIRDHQSRERGEDETVRFTPLSAGAGQWQGYRCCGAEITLTRAVRYVASHGQLVELMIPWQAAVDEALEERLLAGCVPVTPPAQARRWRAFGLDVELAEALPLQQATVAPADALLRFGSGEVQVTVRRRAMVTLPVGLELETWLRQQRCACPVTMREVGTRPHPAFEALGPESAGRWRRWLGRSRLQTDVVWRCDAAAALFQVAVLARADSVWSADRVQVRCCERV